MKNMLSLWTGMLLLCSIPLHAEPLYPMLSLGLDARSWATIDLEVTYPILKEGLQGTMGVSLPILMYVQGSGMDNFQVDLGLASTISPLRDLPLLLSLDLSLTGTNQEQILGDFFGLGTNLGVNATWTLGALGAGITASWHRVWLTYIQLSAESIERFSGSASGLSPAQGWYPWGGSEVSFGPSITITIPKTGVWNLGFGPRLSIGSLAGPLDGFPMGEWPFWLETSLTINLLGR